MNTDKMEIGGDLLTEISEGDYGDLLMDIYFPEIIRGNDADEITATEMLEKLKEADGPGSGLDADLLDGTHAGGFVRRDSIPEGCVLVGGEGGTLADGGNYEDFVKTFDQFFTGQI